MKVRRNLLAGLANSIWSALIGLAVVPLYLKYLGAESYGLIGFFATTQAVLILLDLGLSSTINREVARFSALGNLKQAGVLLHTLAIIYWIMAFIIGLLVIALAPFIAEHWLQSKQLSTTTILHAVMLMGVVIACRWPIGLYQGVLIGAQRLSIYSLINMVMVTAASLGAVAILAFVSATIEAFFMWQAFVGVIYAVTIRIAAWKSIGKHEQLKFDTDSLKSVWRFSVGMSGIGLTALVFTQLDKIILSKMLGLAEFGHYMLATLLASGLYILVIPVYNVVYPRFSALIAAGDTDRLIELYRLGTRMLTTVLFPVAMILVVFSHSILLLWTDNAEIATSTAPVVSLLAIGSALHGAMYFPYALQLASGKPSLALKINGFLIVILPPLTIFFTLKYGMLGGAISWLILHIIYLIFGTWMTHRKLLRGIGAEWLLKDVGIPLMLSTIVGVVGYFVSNNAHLSIFLKLLSGFVLALIALAFSILMSSKLRMNVVSIAVLKKTLAS
ncbi:MAG: oligosaccharide flippase family protein [Pseudomonadota bacterium]